MRGTLTPLDDRDQAILAERTAALDAVEEPRVGDFVVFADGVTRRISYHWHDGAGWDGGYQSSDGGSYYLGTGYVSMSGGLYTTVPKETLTLTDEKRDGSVWFFHHDHHTAHNGVDVMIPFRVYACSLPAPR